MRYVYEDRNKPVCTWLTKQELELFRAICRANNVCPAAYLRAMVVDVLVEEGPRIKIPRRRLPPDLFTAFKKIDGITDVMLNGAMHGND